MSFLILLRILLITLCKIIKEDKTLKKQNEQKFVFRLYK